MNMKKDKKEAKKQKKTKRAQKAAPVRKPEKLAMSDNPLYPPKVESDAKGVLGAGLSVVVALVLLVVIFNNFSYAAQPYRAEAAADEGGATIVGDGGRNQEPAAEPGETEDAQSMLSEAPETEGEQSLTDESAQEQQEPAGESGIQEELTGEEVESEAVEPESEVQESEPEEPVSEEGIHTYEIIVANVSWQQAFDDCISRGGYLARINTQEEWNEVLSQLKNENTGAYYFYLGGSRAENDTSYYWINAQQELYGEPLNSDSFWGNDLWLDGEPSFQDGDKQETALAILYMKSKDKWVWNDVVKNGLYTEEYLNGKIAYICEFE